ncbi:MAG TPA: DNA topoisomerase IB [Actinomycetota bacterium]|nr:DNA topoisomerase IB [Actinomycetota bacterium]
MPRLRRADCSGPGILRRRRGRGFTYLFSNGEAVRDEEILARIKALAIPPAWKDVWICPHPNGHLQAVGVDAAGRRQYLYHENWRLRRDQEKFERMLQFARTLPNVRRRCAADLRLRGFPRDKVLACATRLLDRGFFRIGTEGYAEQNQTYGLATMRKRHVKLKDEGRIIFDYEAKGNQRRIQGITDPEVHEIVAALKRRRNGPRDLLVYKEGRVWVDVKSGDINDYIRDASGGDFTAKDFRTWNATVLAAVALAVSGGAGATKTAKKRAIKNAVDEVAFYLGNTTAIARASYIDPRVFDRYLSGWTISGALEALGTGIDLGAPSFQGAIEEAVLDLLEDKTSSPAIQRLDALEKIA